MVRRKYKTVVDKDKPENAQLDENYDQLEEKLGDGYLVRMWYNQEKQLDDFNMCGDPTAAVPADCWKRVQDARGAKTGSPDAAQLIELWMPNLRYTEWDHHRFDDM